MHRMAAICMALAAVWFIGGAAIAPAAQAEQPVAQVNGAAVREQDVDLETYLVRGEARRVNRPLSEARLSELRPAIVETLIERELLYQTARRKRIDVAARAVDVAFKELKRMRGPLPQTFNLTDADLKARVRKGLIVQRLLYLDVLRHISLSESEIEAFLAQPPESDAAPQVRVRHILIAGKDAAARIRAVQAKIETGTPFALAAFDYSDCPSKHRGGDLGYLTRDQMIPAFAAAVFAMQPGTISDIVETRQGYHLIELIDLRPAAGPVPARPQAERDLLFKRESAAIEAYLLRLKAQADIRR